VINGTTGEAASLSPDERAQVLHGVNRAKAKHQAVMAGITGLRIEDVLANAAMAETAEADALLIAPPPYVLPSDDGLVQWFTRVAEATGLPIYLYDVPKRAGRGLSGDVILKLIEAHPERFVGIKDATGDLGRASDLAIQAGDGFVQLSGDDPSWLGHAAHGGRGVISVTCNVAPRGCVSMARALEGGEWQTAREQHHALMPLHRALFADANPAPTKFALSELDVCSAVVRPPLVPANEHAQDAVKAALKALTAMDASVLA
jgi:4-hydroxy-tetrahydrodipicolinate synthase